MSHPHDGDAVLIRKDRGGTAYGIVTWSDVARIVVRDHGFDLDFTLASEVWTHAQLGWTLEFGPKRTP